MGETVVKAFGVGKKYFRKGRESARCFDAVLPTDLSLVEGELCVLMGRSGSGKTTLLNMLAGLLTPTEGTVRLLGEDVYALDDERRALLRSESIGVVPQGQTVLHSVSVVQNVMLPLVMYKENPHARPRAEELLRRMGIAELADIHASELSGGELRRVAIARALIAKPKLLLADEPTADLDDEYTRVVLDALREHARSGAAVLVVTHDRDAHAYADRLFNMDAGSLECCVSPDSA